METKITIFWFRQDLRLSDNPGLHAAAQNGRIMPIYILEDEIKMGSASAWWLKQSLSMLNLSLDNKLNIYCGNPKDIIVKIVNENNIQAVYWSRCYEPNRIKYDTEIKENLKNIGVECKSFNGSLLWEPWEALKSDGSPYKVFTPFYKNGCLKAPAPRSPLPEPAKLDLIHDANAANIDALIKFKKWHTKISDHWNVGENHALNKLDNFIESKILYYKEGRNFPAQDKVSRLSPHLHFGEISPNQAWYKAQTRNLISDSDSFLSELAWREFSYHLLYYNPSLPEKNFQPKFDNFPWEDNPTLLHLWQKGQTGYPIVDAGMRELWQTGYMHNRVRMIAGSFLVKNLKLHWRHGAHWFWDCLVDADLANNSASWQWVAGSGADAAPFFRIFNPILQGEKFDYSGEYTKKFVPELKDLPDKFLYKPWEAPKEVLLKAGVHLGKNYPLPIVNFEKSRNDALLAYKLL